MQTASRLIRTQSQTQAIRRAASVCGALFVLWTLTGCAAMRPIQAVPARYLPAELKGPSRQNLRMIDLSLLRQRPVAEHCVDSGDVLAVYIEGVLGNREQPPINQTLDGSRPPTLGYPLTVRDDGTLSLPLINPIPVRGRSITQIEEAIRYAYTQERRLLQPGRDRILLTLHQPRVSRVLVVRQEQQSDQLLAGNLRSGLIGATQRGNSRVIALPAYKNDVLNALVESGGLPGLDAENTIYVIRSQRPQKPVASLQYASPPVGAPPYGAPLYGPPGYGPPAYGPAPSMPMPTMRPVLAPSVPARQSPVDGRSADVGNGSIRQMSYEVPAKPSPSDEPASGIQLTSGIMPSPEMGGSCQSYLSGGGTECMNGYQPPPSWNDVDHIARGGLCSSGRTIRIPLRLDSCDAITFNEQDIILEEGDIIFIESRCSEVFYTGGLLPGGQYSLPRDYDVDVLEAISIALAQNSSTSQFGKSALNQDVTISASQAIVLRKLPNGSVMPIRVDIYKARANAAERVRIMPGDFLLLQYTPMEATSAFIEKHIFETALFGVAAATLNRGR